MASELLKRKSLINRLKEPDVPVINFDLIDSAKDYNIESIEEDILPEPKPQELLDLQEQNRKQRLSDSLQKIGSGLMDESVDFIKREEFDRGGMAKLVEYVESLPKGTTVTLQMIQDYVKKNNLKVNIENFFNRRAKKIKGKKFISDTRKKDLKLTDTEKANIEKYSFKNYIKSN